MKIASSSLSLRHHTITRRLVVHRSISTGAVRATQWSFLDTHPSVYVYAAQHSVQETRMLQDIRESTIRHDPAGAQKMVSPLQGAFMAHLVHMQKPCRVLELGCYTGYSAIWLAHALRSCHRSCHSPPPHLWTCERDPSIAAIAQQNIAKSGYSDIMTLLDRPATDVLAHWDPAKKLDLVFIDANKSAYSCYYDLVLDRDLLSEHGQIIVDNVLLHGKVHTLLNSSDKPKKSILSKLHDFNCHVSADHRTHH
ncbi:hypothetical protein IW138_006225, partial [Coemansia sp. RSA 986]